ncbi:MAG: hypothetical protein NT126_09885 [Bacteroidetes bacterium]|nr:hypothetical protein [Bacteroidota bacterium]
MKALTILIVFLTSQNIFGQDLTINGVVLPKNSFQAGSQVILYYETVNDSCKGLIELPKYSLGNKHLGEYLVKNTRQPGNLGETEEGSVTGQLVLSFVVNKIGKIENVEVTSSPHRKVTSNIITAIDKLKDFSPAKCDGNPIEMRIYYVANLVDIFKQE